MLATELAPWFAVTQLMPLMIQLHWPLPWQLSTLTAWMGALGATPTTPCVSSFAAIVPATCVPCPLQSPVLLPPLAKLTD
jgi:hypothetical protein